MNLPSFIVGMPANDSIELATGHDGQLGPSFPIPAGETWTLKLLSEQFYSPYAHQVNSGDPINQQDAMWHLVVNDGSREVNVHTALLRIQQVKPIDGLDYFDYRNTSPCYELTGPMHVRTYAYNRTGLSIIFYVGMVWSRRAA